AETVQFWCNSGAAQRPDEENHECTLMNTKFMSYIGDKRCPLTDRAEESCRIFRGRGGGRFICLHPYRFTNLVRCCTNSKIFHFFFTLYRSTTAVTWATTSVTSWQESGISQKQAKAAKMDKLQIAASFMGCRHESCSVSTLIGGQNVSSA